MEVRAIAKSVRISPRKLRLVADAVRNLPIDEAFLVLRVAQQRAAQTIEKTLTSAIANATNNAKLDRRNLVIKSVMVNEAPAMKRFRPSTRGRIHPYKKRGSHLTIVLQEKIVTAPAVPTVTKPKEEAAEEKKGGRLARLASGLKRPKRKEPEAKS